MQRDENSVWREPDTSLPAPVPLSLASRPFLLHRRCYTTCVSNEKKERKEKLTSVLHFPEPLSFGLHNVIWPLLGSTASFAPQVSFVPRRRCAFRVSFMPPRHRSRPLVVVCARWCLPGCRLRPSAPLVSPALVGSPLVSFAPAGCRLRSPSVVGGLLALLVLPWPHRCFPRCPWWMLAVVFAPWCPWCSPGLVRAFPGVLCVAGAPWRCSWLLLALLCCRCCSPGVVCVPWPSSCCLGADHAPLLTLVPGWLLLRPRPCSRWSFMPPSLRWCSSKYLQLPFVCWEGVV